MGKLWARVKVFPHFSKSDLNTAASTGSVSTDLSDKHKTYKCLRLCYVCPACKDTSNKFKFEEFQICKSSQLAMYVSGHQDPYERLLALSS